MRLGSSRTEIAATMPVQRYVKIKATEDTRLQGAHNLDKYHVEMKSWRDKKVIRKNISPGDLVLIHHLDKQGKLQSQWYGPFIVANMIKPGTFCLLNDEGVKTTHTWNADNLRQFYP